MIDWTLTEEKFNITDLNGHRPKVVCRCDRCGLIKDITIRVKSKLKDRQMAWECPKCVSNRPEVSQKCRQSANKSWQNEEYRLKQSNKSKKLWQDRNYNKTISDKNKAHFSDEEIKEKLRNKYKEKYLDPHYKEQRRQYSTKLWQDQKFRDKVLSAYDDEWRRKHSEIMKIARNRPEVREKLAKSRINQPTISTQQKILYAILDDMGIRYEVEYPIGYYAFDCFLSDYGVLIEVQGEYWHSLPKTISRDKAKATYIERYFPQYQLKYMVESDFLFHNRIIGMLKEWLGIGEVEQVDFDFNDVVISRLDDRSVARDFLNKYHYIGKLGRGGYIYNAIIDDEVIAVGVFSKPTRHESSLRLNADVRELTRFCIHPRYHKRNFASWLLSRFERLIRDDSGCDMLLSFSDPINNNIGIIYKAANWDFDGYTAPSYYYVDQDGYVMHKKTLYNHASKMGMRESEYAVKYKYKKVRVDKKYRYIKRLK